jgi:YhcH/YjgK/YiaL family protein
VQEYETIPPERAAWEAHRQHIDLQCLVCGTERIGYARADRLLAGAYDPGRDLLPLVGTGDFLTLGAGEFMILFPQDAHMPRVAVGAPARVRKVVVKIAIAP